MTQPIARLDDTSDHGGKIVTAASKTKVEGKFVARVKDILDCPIHGRSPILDGSPRFTVEGEKVARSGSKTACGATIIGGAQRTKCE